MSETSSNMLAEQPAWLEYPPWYKGIQLTMPMMKIPHIKMHPMMNILMS